MLVYHHYKNGILPHSGGLVDQHCLFPETMYWLDSFFETFGNQQKDDDGGVTEAEEETDVISEKPKEDKPKPVSARGRLRIVEGKRA